MADCGAIARCGRPVRHRGHHGGWRSLVLAATATNPVLRIRGSLGDPLTPREVDVVAAIMLHGRYKEAAVSLGITEQTIKNYAGCILSKTGASSMNQVPLLLGLVRLPPANEREVSS